VKYRHSYRHQPRHGKHRHRNHNNHSTLRGVARNVRKVAHAGHVLGKFTYDVLRIFVGEGIKAATRRR
jgi:hypothetical protein